MYTVESILILFLNLFMTRVMVCEGNVSSLVFVTKKTYFSFDERVTEVRLKKLCVHHSHIFETEFLRILGFSTDLSNLLQKPHPFFFILFVHIRWILEL